MSRALAIKAMGSSARDSKAQWGQVTEILSIGSGMSYPMARIYHSDYRRAMGPRVDKEMKRSLQLAPTDPLHPRKRSKARLAHGTRPMARMYSGLAEMLLWSTPRMTVMEATAGRN